MVKVIEKKTGTEFKAKRIEGGFEVYTLSGELYKKVRESTFKKYFKATGEQASKAEEPEQATEEPKEEPKQETPKDENPKKKSKKKAAKAEESKQEEPTPEDTQEQESESTEESEEKQEEVPKKEKKSGKKESSKVELDDVNRENMVAKIRKMLNLSENNPSAEEAKSAVLMAQKLMAKYGIHEDEVTLEEVKDEIGAFAARLKHDSSHHSWRKGLALAIAKNFRVKTYMDGHKDMVFRGYKEDVKIASEVYFYLYTLGNSLGSKAYHEKLAETGSGRGVYNSFVLGFVKGIEEALDEQCTALMLVTPKEVEEECAEFLKNSKKSVYRERGRMDENFEKGKAEGKAAVKSKQLSDKKAKK